MIDIPQNNGMDGHVDTNSDNDSDASNADSDDDNDAATVEGDVEDLDDASIPGVRRSRRINKSRTTRFAEYGLMMAARRRARGGNQRAIIRE
jgi:hypothetical protein